MRKILYAPGYGAGWSTWNNGEVAKLMLEYAPIVAAIEQGERMSNTHPAVLQLKQECKERFNEGYVCTLGAEDLVVHETEGRVRVTEYDGFESVDDEGVYTDWV
jgi:hypothetical protein